MFVISICLVVPEETQKFASLQTVFAFHHKHKKNREPVLYCTKGSGLPIPQTKSPRFTSQAVRFFLWYC